VLGPANATQRRAAVRVRGRTLRYIMVCFAGPSYPAPMAHFVFRCPATSLNVEHQSDGDPDISENEYEGIICPACNRLHFINRKNGRLLGEAKKQRRFR
jgi:hypothetical protein